MGWLQGIGAFFSAIGEALGLIKHRSELNNAPDVKAMEIKREEEAAQDKAQKAVKKGNEDEINKLLGCLLVACMLASGCSTVTPGNVKSKQGQVEQQAFKNPDGSFSITEAARWDYNSLITRYGSRPDLFLVPLKPDAGLSPDAVAGRWHIEPDALVNFINMKRWWKEGR